MEEYAPVAVETKKKKTPVSAKEIGFISYSLDEHDRLVSEKCGAMWEHSVQAERARTERTKKALKDMARHGTVTINEEDVMYITFSMCERRDFLMEGVGTPQRSVKADTSRTTAVLRKLREFFSMTEEEAGYISAD